LGKEAVLLLWYFTVVVCVVHMQVIKSVFKELPSCVSEHFPWDFIAYAGIFYF